MTPDTTDLTGRTLALNEPERKTVDLDELERQRQARSWSRARLAEEMGVSRPALYSIYRNGWTSPATAAKLVAAFERTTPSEMTARLLGQPTEGAA
jgi:transcriptional regulator with XRE-family HTH domain